VMLPVTIMLFQKLCVVQLIQKDLVNLAASMKVSCSLSVGAKHLEDKLSVIAKNSSPNASPVQLSVVSCQLSVVRCQLLITYYLLPITYYPLPITHYPLPHRQLTESH
jgi:hypothetical protein